MTYMLLITEPRGQRQKRSNEQGREVYQRMLGFAGELEARGVLRAVDSLKSDDQAVRVQIRDGKCALIDGPFAEAKEMIGGYFLIDCDREQAIAIAAECPAAEWATVEVREVGPCYQ